jgi:multicomponent K+:H+ antiporter subunit E
VALVNQPSLAHLLLGLILGLFIPWFTRAYWPDRPIVKRPVRVLEYAAVVLWDIIVSNVQVAYLVLFRRGESLHSQFVSVPLDLLTPA